MCLVALSYFFFLLWSNFPALLVVTFFGFFGFLGFLGFLVPDDISL